MGDGGQQLNQVVLARRPNVPTAKTCVLCPKGQQQNVLYLVNAPVSCKKRRAVLFLVNAPVSCEQGMPKKRGGGRCHGTRQDLAV
jgi:hypothetical protein